ncbi:MAG TPA: hypothetical protein VIK91_24350 [Nannocystis sp.]
MNRVQRFSPRLPPPFGLAAALLFAGACSDDDGRASTGGGFSGGGIVTVTTATTVPDPGSGSGEPTTGGDTAGDDSAGGTTGDGVTGGSTTGTSGAAPDEGENPGGGPKFDLGATPDVGETGGATESKPCVKVDLLFVIDNSGSMEDEQANLIAGFPAFVNGMQKELADAESLHIGVVTTDAYEYNEPGCAEVLGALVTQTGGDGSSNGPCGPYASGKRFMTEKDNLPQSFACAGQVGIDGDGNERPIDAAIQALGPGLGAPGACNEGFAREDALLVLVIITDEEEEASIGDPPQWFNTLVAQRGGIETNIVVLSLIGPQHPPCQDAAEVGHRLIEFTNMFTYGSVGEICAPSYQKFFLDAISGIAEACEGFTPPG